MDKLSNSLIRIIPDFPKPGIIFKDITPLLADSETFHNCCAQFAKYAEEVDYIAGIEARGFILAAAVAVMSGKGFIPIRKSGKLPGQVFSQNYELEYSSDTLEIHADLIPAGRKVLIIDDVLASGGTALAAINLIEKADLKLGSVAFLLEIDGLGGRRRINTARPGLQIHTILAG